MNASKEKFRDFVLDQLAAFGPVEACAMFGGYGLYRGEVFFGILHKNRLYFKTDPAAPESTAPYRERKMLPFRPSKKQPLKSYYEVPADVLEDPRELADWAERAARCQEL
ncbi:MAG: hypothetical protein A3G34_01785 [Candidatus Lindowbacteria bacterium RIFCSPLOWO2_12_FULL_62_27]|nr:MAG: hypothetical protein A3I06_05730 [Candidatus Lindowbacteria bacterium RIFCSPLOWO2_02_FULL_62_12]OGH59040.1 MAG: hypothetical protein A3G34_01785 [Candidatus Lindowbacteria bacterium RIFCSPLOWO2_12_FULL_62_27]